MSKSNVVEKVCVWRGAAEGSEKFSELPLFIM
jgi:hypothetical protein